MRSGRGTDMISQVVVALGRLADDVVFVGSTVLGFLLSDPAAPGPRPTEDVDVIVEVASLLEYNHMEQAVRDRGFEDEGTKIGRFVGHGVLLDVIPTLEGIFGFTNEWYTSGTLSAVIGEPSPGIHARHLDAPHFIATKLVAYASRGMGDMYGSRDFEDIVALVDGRPELGDELSRAPAEVAAYVASQFGDILRVPGFQDAVEGHLAIGSQSRARSEIVLKRMRGIAGEE